MKDFAKQMFNAGSDLKTKTPEEIFYQDFKKFNIDETEFGVGQISSMNEEELENLKKKLLPYMEKVAAETELSMIFFMLTNILEESTELIYCGKMQNSWWQTAFTPRPGKMPRCCRVWFPGKSSSFRHS